MLLVKTYFAPSSIHGTGLFASELIPKDTKIWQYDKTTTQTYWKNHFLNHCSQLSLKELKELLHNSYIRRGVIYNAVDDARFVNHSLAPNIAFRNDSEEYSLTDIYAGEEILKNYFLSYDENDFFNLEIHNLTSRNEILSRIRDNILTPIKPKRKFLVHS